jgi:hypothetical protein
MIKYKEFLLEIIERIRPILISGLLALPVGGFIFGAIHADGGGLVGRLFIGLIFALLTSMFGGFPPRNEGGVGEPYNAWPCIIAAWIVLVGFWYAYRWISTRPNETTINESTNRRQA